MEKNIFEGAKFGDKFVTRNGREACYILYNDESKRHYLWIKGHYCHFEYSNDGKWDSLRKNNGNADIVSRYQESIDEDKLDELVENKNPYKRHTSIPYMEWEKGFKSGYRSAFNNKAMEE